MLNIPLGEAVGLQDRVTNKGGKELRAVPLPGRWKRVIPETYKDVFWLQGLDNQNEKYAPAEGDGLLIKEQILLGRGKW